MELFAGGFFADGNHFRDALGAETDGGIAVEGRIDVDVGIGLVFAVFFEVGTVEKPTEQAFDLGDVEDFGNVEIIVIIFFVVVIDGEIDGDHRVGSQFSGDIDGQVVEQSAVEEHVAVVADG